MVAGSAFAMAQSVAMGGAFPAVGYIYAAIIGGGAGAVGGAVGGAAGGAVAVQQAVRLT